MKLSKRSAIITASIIALMGVGSASALFINQQQPAPSIASAVTTKDTATQIAPTDTQPVVNETPTTETAPTQEVASEPTPAPDPQTPDLMTQAHDAVIANMVALVPTSQQTDGDKNWQWVCFQRMITSPQGPGFTDETATMAFIDKYKNITFDGTCSAQIWHTN